MGAWEGEMSKPLLMLSYFLHNNPAVMSYIES